MRIELSEGEAVVVTFRGTDGEITVAFKPEDVQILTGCREDVARELPGGAAGPLVAVAPAGVEDFEPGGEMRCIRIGGGG